MRRSATGPWPRSPSSDQRGPAMTLSTASSTVTWWRRSGAIRWRTCASSRFGSMMSAAPRRSRGVPAHCRDDGEDARAGLARAGLAEDERMAGEHVARHRPVRRVEHPPLGHDKAPDAGADRLHGRRGAHPVDEPQRRPEVRRHRGVELEQAPVHVRKRLAVRVTDRPVHRRADRAGELSRFCAGPSPRPCPEAPRRAARAPTGPSARRGARAARPSRWRAPARPAAR